MPTHSRAFITNRAIVRALCCVQRFLPVVSFAQIREIRDYILGRGEIPSALSAAYYFLVRFFFPFPSSSAAWAAARREMGTRKGEQET